MGAASSREWIYRQSYHAKMALPPEINGSHQTSFAMNTPFDHRQIRRTVHRLSRGAEKALIDFDRMVESYTK